MFLQMSAVIICVFHVLTVPSYQTVDTIQGTKRELKSWTGENGETVQISNANTNMVSYSDEKDEEETKHVHSRKKRATSLSQSDIQTVVDKHNSLRKLEGSSDMRYMIWNTELADMAQTWADACDFIHGQPSGTTHSVYGTTIGQNLFMTTGSVADLDSAIQAWYNEKSDYIYSNSACNSGKVCGHYTQVVWANSYEVGCGVKTCTPLTDSSNGNSWPTGTQLVCNYGPAGNAGGSPYTQGDACTFCRSGIFDCFDSLCRDNCTGVSCECKAISACQNCANTTNNCGCSCQDGWTGVNCAAECKNTDNRCNNGWFSHWCDNAHSYVLTGCPLMCNVCQQSSGTSTCATSGGTGNGNSGGTSGGTGNGTTGNSGVPGNAQLLNFSLTVAFVTLSLMHL